MPIRFRPITPDDIDFLFQVYASTRLDELAVLNWSQEQVGAFLTQQFYAQHNHYQQAFKEAAYDIILLDDKAIGRLYVERNPHEIHIIDIALLPQYRNQGIGSQLLKDILAEAGACGSSVRIYVEQFNPALRLYERLGFRKLQDEGVYFLMQWQPTVKN